MNNRTLNRVILLTCFFDMLSYAMLSPLLGLLFIRGPFCIINPDHQLRHLILGAFLSTYSFVQFFAAPFWAKMSFHITKERILTFTYLINAFGYGVFYAGLRFQKIGIVFLGFFISGLSGASFSTINAVIAESVPKDKWSQHYSFIGFLIATSFIIGPLATGTFLERLPGLNISMLLALLCMSISIINSLLTYLFVTTTNPSIEREAKPIPLRNLFSFFLSHTCKTGSKKIFIFMFLVYFSWFLFIKFFQIYLHENIGLSEKECCYLTSYLGICCAFWQGFRTIKNPRLLDNPLSIKFSSLLMGFSLLLFLLSKNIVLTVFSVFLMSFCYTAIIPSSLSLLLRMNSHYRELQTGFVQSTQSLAKILAPLISGAMMSSFGVKAPVLGVLSLALAFLFFNSEVPPVDG